MDNNDINTSAEMWEKIMNFSSKAPHYANQIHPLLGSLRGFLNTDGHGEKATHLLKMLTTLNDFQLNKVKPPAATTATKKESHSLTGNHFYDLFNSPAMKDVVKEVLSHRRKKKL